MFTFTPLGEQHLEQVLKWRTQPEVTRYMYSDVEYDMNRQRQWYTQIKDSLSEKYWIVELKGEAVGVISLNDLNITHQRTSWGYYIGEERARLYGGFVPLYLYNYVFNQLGLHKITAEVMAGNDNVIKLHRSHGYREVGIYYDQIYKYGEYHNVHILELLKTDWQAKHERYAKYTAKF